MPVITVTIDQQVTKVASHLDVLRGDIIIVEGRGGFCFTSVLEILDENPSTYPPIVGIVSLDDYRTRLNAFREHVGLLKSIHQEVTNRIGTMSLEELADRFPEVSSKVEQLNRELTPLVIDEKVVV